MPNRTQKQIKELIAKAKRHKWTELDLRGKGLTVLPRSIGNLTHLKTLHLGNNQLIGLPKSVANLTNLSKLFLDHNRLSRLPDSVAKLTSLTLLFLNDNQLSELPESFGTLTNLNELALSNNLLSGLPESFGTLTNITILRLNDNPLKPALQSACEEGLDVLMSYLRGLADLPQNDVEEYIAQVKRDEGTELDLSHEGLTELPDSVTNLTKLKSLDLSGNRLTELPESIVNLTNLTTFYLSENRVSALPDSVANLTNLTTLDLRNNQINELPESISNLTNLTKLNLSENHLSGLPETISNLTNLTMLYLTQNQLQTLPKSFVNLTNLAMLFLAENQLGELPKSFTNLTNLTMLFLGENQLDELPKSFANLTNLSALDLRGNQLNALPESVANLTNLKTLNLTHNPLNPALQSAYDAGLDSLRAYLAALADDTTELYEAKLVLVGEGGVGKTSMMKVLSGKEPDSQEETTHGIHVSLGDTEIAHPEIDGQAIQFNAWDFGGQEVYRVTHQFYFSPNAIYVLVWEPRRDVAGSQVEDWLKMIRNRVGSEAKVLIVSTHAAGERIARIDEAVFMRDYDDLIVGFCAVDSFVDDPDTNDKVGFADLRRKIASASAELPQIGQEFSVKWLEARDTILKQKEARITFEEFYAICRDEHEMEEIDAFTLALIMNDAGYIVYYGKDERLKHDVILQPEWLTKAIGYVLEDATTHSSSGVLPDSHLANIWDKRVAGKRKRYSRNLYPFFLDLMEANEVSYRIDGIKASLVAQHVPQVRPELPWRPEEPDSDIPTVTLICVFDDAPEGIVPRMIVRTHDHTVEKPDDDGNTLRLHWSKGMFLQHGVDGKHGEAMLELRENELYIQVRGARPQFFSHILQSNLTNLIEKNWPGMKGEYQFTVPCPTITKNAPCSGRFEIDALEDLDLQGISVIPCQKCRKVHSIPEILKGLKPTADNATLTAEMVETLLAEQTQFLMEQLASESKDGPRLYTVEKLEDEGGVGSQRYRLTLWCEAEGCQHKVAEEGKGSWEFNVDDAWMQWSKEVTKKISTFVRLGLPVAGRLTDAFLGEGTMKDAEIASDFDAAAQIGNIANHVLDDPDQPITEEVARDEVERFKVLMLHEFLRKHDPYFKDIGLRRKVSHTAGYQWLCPVDYRDNPPEIPDA